jgi:hypothetical protein
VRWTAGGHVGRLGSPVIETLPLPLMVAVQQITPPAMLDR